MATKSTSVVEMWGGKIKGVVEYNFTTTGISFTAYVQITKALKSAVVMNVKYYDPSIGGWYESQSAKNHKAVGKYKVTSDTIQAEKLQMKFGVGLAYKATLEDISTTLKAVAPYSLKTSLQNVSLCNVTVSGYDYATIRTDEVKLERSNDNKLTWSQIGETHELDETTSTERRAYSETWGDTSLEENKTYYYRASAMSDATGSEVWSGYVYSDAVITNAGSGSSVIASLAVTLSGLTATVSWTSPVEDVSLGTITGFYVYYSVDGGSYQQVATVAGHTTTTVYSTTVTLEKGHTYTFAVKAYGPGGDAFELTECTTEIDTGAGTSSGTEAGEVTAYRKSNDDVLITVTGGSTNSEKIYIERSIDSAAWTVIATEDYASPLEYTDEGPVATDTLQYRVRWYNSNGYSDYVYSNVVAVKSRPSAPDLVSPGRNAVISTDAGTVRLVWKHRPTDGSAQEAATLMYQVGSGSWVTETFTTETYKTLDISGYSPNTVISWKVKTKGAYSEAPDGGYSDYSETRTFTLKKKPQLVFTKPVNAAVISTLPVTLAWTYNDESGNLKELTVEIEKDHETVKSISVDVGTGASGTYTYDLSDFLFENDSVYALNAAALSTSGLSTTANIAITIQYAHVSLDGGLIPMAWGDEETGYTYINIDRDVTEDPSTGQPYAPLSIREAYLYRTNEGGEKELVESNLSEGMVVTDKYAPINIDANYELLQITTDGRVSIVETSSRNNSDLWFVYWGDDNIAAAKWNPEGSVSLARPQKTQVRYSGRRYPVSYDQDAVEETFDFSTAILDRSVLDSFRKMMRDGGQGIWKSGDGDVYDADFEFSYSADYKTNVKYWEASLSVTRIDGGE